MFENGDPVDQWNLQLLLLFKPEIIMDIAIIFVCKEIFFLIFLQKNFWQRRKNYCFLFPSIIAIASNNNTSSLIYPNIIF